MSSVSAQVTTSGAPVVELAPIKVVKRRVGDNEAPGDVGFTLRPPAPETEPGEVKQVVAFVRPGGPAMLAGLAAGDEIVSVDGQDVTGVNGYLFRQLIQVKAGTKLKLGLARGAIVELTADKGQ